MTTITEWKHSRDAEPEDLTRYEVIVDGVLVGSFDNVEDAAREWDRQTYLTGGIGGITVQTWDGGGLMVRDGWLLHVTATKTYLNPRITREA
jgi:hypothetical protein